jgi:hypothetical protein
MRGPASRVAGPLPRPRVSPPPGGALEPGRARCLASEVPDPGLSSLSSGGDIRGGWRAGPGFSAAWAAPASLAGHPLPHGAGLVSAEPDTTACHRRASALVVEPIERGRQVGAAREPMARHARRRLPRGWFEAGRWATGELYRRHGWGPLVYGPLPGHRVSGCEQTVLVVGLLSGGSRAAVDGACAGIVAALEEIEEAGDAGDEGRPARAVDQELEGL